MNKADTKQHMKRLSIAAEMMVKKTNAFGRSLRKTMKEYIMVPPKASEEKFKHLNLDNQMAADWPLIDFEWNNESLRKGDWLKLNLDGYKEFTGGGTRED